MYIIYKDDLNICYSRKPPAKILLPSFVIIVIFWQHGYLAVSEIMRNFATQK